jgi:hypothetical protein
MYVGVSSWNFTEPNFDRERLSTWLSAGVKSPWPEIHDAESLARVTVNFSSVQPIGILESVDPSQHA